MKLVIRNSLIVLGLAWSSLVLASDHRNADPEMIMHELISSVDGILNVMTTGIPLEYEQMLDRMDRLNSVSGIQYDGEYFYGISKDGREVRVLVDEVGIYSAMITGKHLHTPFEVLRKINANLDRLDRSIEVTPAGQLKSLAHLLNKNTETLSKRIRDIFRLASGAGDNLYHHAKRVKHPNEKLYFYMANTISRLSEEGAWPLAETVRHNLKEISDLISESLVDIAEGRSQETVAKKLETARLVLRGMQENIRKNQDLLRYRNLSAAASSPRAKVCRVILEN